jgi:hypothetical protein
MGWLRDLMLAGGPDLRSFDALARAALQHASWPNVVRAQPRSLAAIFSKLDRGIDLDWLIERPAVQLVLAELLGAPLVALQRQSEQRRREADARAARVRFSDLRHARPLELAQEALCPGIPAEVVAPLQWSPIPVWWEAPSGSGRSLVGQWLSARGLATHVAARTWKEAAACVHGGATFIELTGTIGESAETPLPPSARVCVAAAFAPPTGQSQQWSVIRSPNPETIWRELAAWVEARLPADDQFSARSAAEWLSNVAAPHGLVQTAGDVLALCGMLDELGSGSVARISVPTVARRFVRQRAEDEVRRGSDDVAWMLDKAYPVLVALARRLLTDETQPWHQPRSFEQWLELVPLEHKRGGDLEWLRLSLSAPGSSVRPRDVEKAARRLPPGAFKILRGLQAIGLLRSDESANAYALRPNWLWRVIHDDARQALVREGPLEWGEALLRPHASSDLMTTLMQRARKDPDVLIEAILELQGDRDLTEVAALEATFRAVGLVLVEGGEVTSEQLESLWQEQASVWLERRDAPPLPRVPFPIENELAAPELHTAAFHVAAIAIAEHLPIRSAGSAGVLSPWRSASPPDQLRGVLDSVAEWLEGTAAERGRWVLGVFALVDRLRRAVGSVSSGTESHPLELPGEVLDEIAHGVLTWPTAARLGNGKHTLDGLLLLAPSRKLSERAIALACWGAWEAAGPGTPLGFLLHRRGVAVFWRHLPVELLPRALSTAHEHGEPVPIDHLTREHWSFLFANDLNVVLQLQELERVLRAVPPDTLELCRRQLLPHRRLAAALWAVCPDLMLADLSDLVEEHPDLATLSAAASTPSTRGDVCRQLLELRVDRLADAALEQLIDWLQLGLKERQPGYRDGYALLNRIERERASSILS